jgi:oligopeptide/dipeptide ABC transporter ATP-binding protein
MSSRPSDAPVLAAENVTAGYGSRGKPVLHNVSLEVRRNRTLGLVGESGSGKSTLARNLVGLMKPQQGQILFHGEDTAGASSQATRLRQRRVQLIPQDPYASLDPRRTIGQTIAEAIQPGGFGSRARNRKRVAELLQMVSLPAGDMDRYPHEFSGGQRQRVAIARALAVEPEVIVADEITSALDNSVQAGILNLLRGIQEQTSIGMLLISHNLAVVQYMCDEVAIMYLGRIVEQGSDELFASPRHPYTQMLLDSVPDLGRAQAFESAERDLLGEPPDPNYPPPGCPFHPRCRNGPAARDAREICSVQLPDLVLGGSDSLYACHFPYHLASRPGELLPVSLSEEKE